jgi:hypothetical protein
MSAQYAFDYSIWLEHSLLSVIFQSTFTCIRAVLSHASWRRAFLSWWYRLLIRSEFQSYSRTCRKRDCIQWWIVRCFDKRTQSEIKILFTRFAFRSRTLVKSASNFDFDVLFDRRSANERRCLVVFSSSCDSRFSSICARKNEFSVRDNVFWRVVFEHFMIEYDLR